MNYKYIIYEPEYEIWKIENGEELLSTITQLIKIVYNQPEEINIQNS